MRVWELRFNCDAGLARTNLPASDFMAAVKASELFFAEFCAKNPSAYNRIFGLTLVQDVREVEVVSNVPNIKESSLTKETASDKLQS